MEFNFKYTPGPWHVSQSPPMLTSAASMLQTKMLYKHVKDKAGIGGKIIAKCLNDNPETIEANARLIAAAPEMARFINDFVSKYESYFSSFEHSKHILYPVHTEAVEILNKLK